MIIHDPSKCPLCQLEFIALEKIKVVQPAIQTDSIPVQSEELTEKMTKNEAPIVSVEEPKL